MGVAGIAGVAIKDRCLRAADSPSQYKDRLGLTRCAWRSTARFRFGERKGAGWKAGRLAATTSGFAARGVEAESLFTRRLVARTSPRPHITRLSMPRACSSRTARISTVRRYRMRSRFFQQPSTSQEGASRGRLFASSARRWRVYRIEQSITLPTAQGSRRVLGRTRVAARVEQPQEEDWSTYRHSPQK